MNLASRQSMWGKAPLNFSDWSLETALSLRKRYAQQLPKFNSMPNLVATTILPLTCYNLRRLLLSDYDEKIGIFYKSSSSSTYFNYGIFDYSTSTFQNTGIQIPCNASDNIAACINNDGILIAAVRSAKKIYALKQDGSDMELIASFSANFSTSFGIRLYYNYDGTCLLFGEDTTNGPSFILSRDLQLSNGPNMNSTYPYSYIKLPGYAAVVGSTGVVSLFNEDMTTKFINNRSIGSYQAYTSGFFVPPKDDEIIYGESCRSANIGINYKTFANITSSQSSFYINGSGHACFLPNGQLFYIRNMNYGSTTGAKYTLYDYLTDEHIDIESTSIITGFFIMPSGRIGSLRRINDYQIELKLFDFGISKKYTPANLCFGPFGYNGSFCQ